MNQLIFDFAPTAPIGAHAGLRKACISCGETKAISEFYRHAGMSDGYRANCKRCKSRDDREHYVENRDRVRESQRIRSKLPHSVLARKAYDQTEKRKSAAILGNRAWRLRNPDKHAAHRILQEAVRTGRVMRPIACSSCGGIHRRIDGHHPDHSKPLFVVWLCRQCHSDAHRHDRRTKAHRDLRAGAEAMQ